MNLLEFPSRCSSLLSEYTNFVLTFFSEKISVLSIFIFSLDCIEDELGI